MDTFVTLKEAAKTQELVSDLETLKDTVEDIAQKYPVLTTLFAKSLENQLTDVQKKDEDDLDDVKTQVIEKTLTLNDTLGSNILPIATLVQTISQSKKEEEDKLEDLTTVKKTLSILETLGTDKLEDSLAYRILVENLFYKLSKVIKKLNYLTTAETLLAWTRMADLMGDFLSFTDDTSPFLTIEDKWQEVQTPISAKDVESYEKLIDYLNKSKTCAKTSKIGSMLMYDNDKKTFKQTDKGTSKTRRPKSVTMAKDKPVDSLYIETILSTQKKPSSTTQSKKRTSTII